MWRQRTSCELPLSSQRTLRKATSGPTSQRISTIDADELSETRFLVMLLLQNLPHIILCLAFLLQAFHRFRWGGVEADGTIVDEWKEGKRAGQSGIQRTGRLWMSGRKEGMRAGQSGIPNGNNVNSE